MVLSDGGERLAELDVEEAVRLDDGGDEDVRWMDALIHALLDLLLSVLGGGDALSAAAFDVGRTGRIGDGEVEFGADAKGRLVNRRPRGCKVVDADVRALEAVLVNVTLNGDRMTGAFGDVDELELDGVMAANPSTTTSAPTTKNVPGIARIVPLATCACQTCIAERLETFGHNVQVVPDTGNKGGGDEREVLAHWRPVEPGSSNRTTAGEKAMTVHRCGVLILQKL